LIIITAYILKGL